MTKTEEADGVRERRSVRSTADSSPKTYGT